MPTPALKSLRKVWSDSCKSMWVELLALHQMRASVLGSYATLGAEQPLAKLTFAPECENRINDVTKEFYLRNFEEFVSHVATARVVILAAAFETYFEEFLGAYLDKRPKYFTGGTRTKDGNRVWGNVMTIRGVADRIDGFAVQAGVKTSSLLTFLPALRDVYLIRNAIAHDAGICDEFTAGALKGPIKGTKGQRLKVSSAQLVGFLAPACFKIAENLDQRV